MKRVGIITIVLLGLIVLNGAAHAEIFKWVDANGKVHYSDRKMNTKAQQLNVKTGTATIGQDSKHNRTTFNISAKICELFTSRTFGASRKKTRGSKSCG